MSVSIGLITSAYVVAAVLFILALGGLSNQETAKRAIWYGIVGMVLAVEATLVTPGVGAYGLVVLMIALGGVGGWLVANRVQMTQMPELVAGFHSLVGLAAVFIRQIQGSYSSVVGLPLFEVASLLASADYEPAKGLR